MTKRKKLLQLHQIKKHLKEKKILLFYQYSNISTRDWGILRGELLNEISICQSSTIARPLLNNSDNVETTNYESSISTLVVKSKIGQLSLAKALTQVEHMANTDNPFRCPSNNTKCAKLLQGPTFLFTCNSHHEMLMGCKVIEKKRDRYNNNHAILLGGIYYGKVATHLDIAKLSSLDSSIYASLFVALESRTTSLLFDQLSYYQYELLRCLEYRRNSLSGMTE